MASSVRLLLNQGNEVTCVVGGGIAARQYINAAASLGASHGVCDYFGILVSRLNARLFIEALGDIAYPDPPESLQQLCSFSQSGKVVVLGGLQPGQSTTTVAALCAEYLKANLILYCSNVPAVYTGDPRKNPDAKKLEDVTYKDLQFLCGVDNSAPGQYQIMDTLALTILERSRLTAIILEGTHDNIEAVMRGERVGTKVGPR